MTEREQKCIEAYRRHEHLGLAAEELGMKWQTLYWVLKKVGEPVKGNKSKHGSDKDKFAALAEAFFKQHVPFAKDMNKRDFQPKCDFECYGSYVEVKAAKPSPDLRNWCFSTRKQAYDADYFVCFGYSKEDFNLEACFIFPAEIVGGMQTLRVGRDADGKPKGKWSPFEVSVSDLAEFFSNLREAA